MAVGFRTHAQTGTPTCKLCLDVCMCVHTWVGGEVKKLQLIFLNTFCIRDVSVYTHTQEYKRGEWRYNSLFDVFCIIWCEVLLQSSSLFYRCLQAVQFEFKQTIFFVKLIAWFIIRCSRCFCRNKQPLTLIPESSIWQNLKANNIKSNI